MIEPFGQLMSYMKVPLITYSSTAVTTNRTSFTTMTRISTGAANHAKGIARMCKYYNWAKVSLVAETVTAGINSVPIYQTEFASRTVVKDMRRT